MTTASGAAAFSNADPVLHTIELSVGYRSGRDRRAVLDRLNLRVHPGQLVCLMGANGSGKSTLLRTLAGTQPPMAGAVELGGRDVHGMDALQLARRLAVVLTERPIVGALTAIQLVSLGRYAHAGWFGRLSPRDVHVVRRAIEAVGACHLAQRQYRSLSDGERQRLMIARALAQEPAVLLLDEPTASLDVTSRTELMGLLRTLTRDEQLAVVLSTHDLELALRTADTVWIVSSGQLHVGTPDDLARDGRLERAFSGSRGDRPHVETVA